MCDTFVALGKFTRDGAVIFGKNSDREPNEAHEICIYPAADHVPGSKVQCTYRELPQAAHTYAVLLARPFWIWGAEMGMNEHGVTIGNEAIFTKVPQEPGKGLIGMDFIRLALERSRTAREALDCITGLLETYGQGGNCGFTHPFYYHNSYLIADPQDAWVLETAGRQWAAEQVTGIRSISNAATIGDHWDLASPDLVQYAIDKGWCKDRKGFNFARCYSDFALTTMSAARSRQICTTDLLQGHQGSIDARLAMQFLRSHGAAEDIPPRIDMPLTGALVCMHAGAGPVRGSQSTGSMVAHLTENNPTAWVTGTSAPCTSIFKPVWLDAGVPLHEPSPDGRFNAQTLWWRHEVLHRTVLEDYAARISLYAAERDQLEEKFLAEAAAVEASSSARLALSAQCFQAAGQAEAEWLNRMAGMKPVRPPIFYYSLAWKSFKQQAGMKNATEQI